MQGFTININTNTFKTKYTMKNKEKLERAGWIYEGVFVKFELYSRGNLRVLYVAEEDCPLLYYEISTGSYSLWIWITDDIFETLTETK